MEELYRVRISEPAADDLDRFIDFVQPELWSWAVRMELQALEDITVLERFPRLAMPSTKFVDLRSFVSGPFRIFYKIDEDAKTVRIMRFWPTRRRSPRRKDLGS